MKNQLCLLFIFCCAHISTLFAQQNQIVYASETLEIHQISSHTFVHVSFLQTEDFGKVACNGMVVLNGGEALVFDTPADDASSLELINWLEKEKRAILKGVLATHFHNDCLGGLNEFHAQGIPSFGSQKTIDLAKATGDAVPQEAFEGQLNLKVGDLEVQSRFLGEGHTRDNVVSYVPAEGVLFGGCLIKEVGASVGYLGDANTGAWSETVRRVKSTFSEVKTVIPGHGKIGGVELLDFTIWLFAKE